MNKKLFIWHPKNHDIKFARQLRKMGFNAWRIPVEPFWTEASYWGVFSNEDKQKFVAVKMFALYEELKNTGYEFFIIDAGWGLGSYDNNYFYEKIFNRFKQCNDVVFDWGECYEDYVEKKKMTLQQYKEAFQQRYKLIGSRLIVGATARNKKNFGANSLTSYLNQKKYWSSEDSLAWIFGQSAWHNFAGSLCYKSKARQLKKLSVNLIGLYQGNPAEWNSIGWENKLMKLFGLKECFEEWQRNRFIKYFGEFRYEQVKRRF